MRFLIKRLVLLALIIFFGYSIFAHLTFSIPLKVGISIGMIALVYLSYDIGNLVGWSQGASWTRSKLDGLIQNTFGMMPEELAGFNKEQSNGN